MNERMKIETRTAFAPMKAKIDPGISAKLPRSAQPAPAAKATPAKDEEIQAPGSESPSPTGLMVTVTCELWLEVVREPERLNAVWGYILRQNPPGIQRITV